MPKYLDIVCAEKMKGRDDYDERKNQTKVYRMHSTSDRYAFDWMQSPAGWNNGDYDLPGNGTDANRCHRTACRSNRGYDPNRVCEGNGAVCNGASRDGTTCDGTTCNGTTCNGATCNGATCNGASCDGTSCDRTSRDGTSCDGASGNGTTRYGTTRYGTTRYRTSRNGAACNRTGDYSGL